MSNYKAKRAINVFAKVVSVVLILLLIVGVVGVVVRYLNSPKGLYIKYGDTVYGNTQIENATGGLAVTYNETATFSIGNSEDWGVYSVTDCTVKIVPNADETHDFEFTVDGKVKPYVFSAESDLTAAFVDNYDGKGLHISDDGTFMLNSTPKYVTDILRAVYGDKAITVSGEYSVAEYPYIALSVTSPDKKQSLTVPLRWYIAVDGIKFDETQIVF